MLETCLLCTEEHRKGNLLTKELEEGFTVEDGIKQYFRAAKHILTSPSSTSICMICFKTLKNFYEFTSQIDERFPPLEPEPPIEIPLESPPKLLEPKFEILDDTSTKYETFEPDDLTVDENYLEEEHLDENFLNEELPTLTEEQLEPKEEKVTRKVGRPKKNQRFPYSAKAPIKYDDLYTPPYKNRRAHPRNDTEGDQKIKNLVDMKCHECNEEFDKFIEITKHFREMHPGLSAYLICCGKKFNKRAMLLDHVEYHDRSAIYRCDECNKEFRTKAILRNHRRKFHVECPDPVMCGDCGKFFSNKYTLKTHMRTHFVDNERQYECYVCHKAFKNLIMLLDHFKYRHDPAHNRLMVCHICSKTVTRLEIHLRMVHSEEPNERIRCEICGHNLKKTSLKGHMKKHTESEQQMCEICNQILKNKNTYKCHMKRVHGEGKFRCEYCEKKFHQRGHLQDHIACQHTGAFLHTCRAEGCGRQFRNVGRRGLHEKRMHREEYETKFKPMYLRQNVEVVEYLEEDVKMEEN